MDRVRFGRALGTGAREAAKALLKAADAAAAPDPSPPARSPQVQVQQPARVKLTTANVKRGGRKFGEAVWAPMAKAGSVLWLEVTGVLFGLFAMVIGAWVWGASRGLDGRRCGKAARVVRRGDVRGVRILHSVELRTRLETGKAVARRWPVAGWREAKCLLRYQCRVPGGPLNGPRRFDVIQPP